MKFSSIVRIAIAALLLVPYFAIAAQELSIADVIKGEKLPTSMKVSGIPPDFKAVRLSMAGGGSGTMYGMDISDLMLIGMTNGSQSDPKAGMVQALSAIWTNGHVVKVNGNEFLVTYKIDASTISPHGQGGADANPALMLNLVRTDLIASIMPLQNVTPKDVEGYLSGLSTAVTPTQDTIAPPMIDQQASPAQISAAKTATLSNVKQVALATIMYASDYDDVLPAVQGTHALQFVTYPYCKNITVWNTMNPNGGSILFNMALSGVNIDTIPSQAEMVMMYESKQWPDGSRIVAFTDGHVKAVDPQEWTKLAAWLKARLKKTAKFLPLNYGKDFHPGH